jgi:hypothetical protein
MRIDEHKPGQRWKWWLAFAFASVLTVAALPSAQMGHDLQAKVITDNQPEIFGSGDLGQGPRGPDADHPPVVHLA